MLVKRTDLIKQITRAAQEAGVLFELHREGGSHTVYKINGLSLPIPRHREINERTAQSILADAMKQIGDTP